MTVLLFSALADVYGVSLADLVAANPDISPDASLVHGPTARVLDPIFTPLLAAFLSAKVLSCPDFASGKRIEMILKLVSPASTNPTALDTVLGRLLLALRKNEEADPVALKTCLEKIARAVSKYEAPRPANPRSGEASRHGRGGPAWAGTAAWTATVHSRPNPCRTIPRHCRSGRE